MSNTKTPSRAATLAAAKAQHAAHMVVVAAITGKKADRAAAAPAALAEVRKLMVGHFRQNPEKTEVARIAFRAVTGTEAAEWDAVLSPMLGGIRQNLAELRAFLAAPDKALIEHAFGVAAAFEGLPEWARSAKTDPTKARARAQKLEAKDWTKVRAACAVLAAAMSADFAKLDQPAKVAETEATA